MRIEWTDPALDGLEAVRDLIAKDSPYYAKRFIERIFEAVETLSEHPEIGRRVPEADRDDIRELIYLQLPNHLPHRTGFDTGPDRPPRQPGHDDRGRQALGHHLTRQNRAVRSCHRSSNAPSRGRDVPAQRRARSDWRDRATRSRNRRDASCYGAP